MKPERCASRLSSKGFTLAELAIVLVIVALLTSGLLISLSAQQEAHRINSAEKQLQEINDALLGFAAAQGRLPCPATNATLGTEALCSNAADASPANNACGAVTTPELLPAVLIHGRCAAPLDGFLPAATLGLRPVNDQGQLIDAWNNPVRYAITTSQDGTTFKYSYSSSNGMRDSGLANLQPSLTVCSRLQSAAACATNATLTSTAVAVYFSSGKTNSNGTDEAANRDGNTIFVSHTPTPAGAPNGEFDDLVVWLSPNILYNRMIAAGRLP